MIIIASNNDNRKPYQIGGQHENNRTHQGKHRGQAREGVSLDNQKSKKKPIVD